MDYKTTISSLYFLLIHADGDVGEKEMLRGLQMRKAEGIDEVKFNLLVEKLKAQKPEEVYRNCISGLKKLDIKSQIRCIAWLCVVANADGFMDKKEWMLIYKIYQNELNLKLDEIMITQKELNKILHGKEFLSLGVKV
ncbi:MAG TPA: TerB family tellurite resistance protein [Cyclobacteriaceae bacterium]|nr:TerB family tellurite resistance protein [Cyclobacteriaceae bacterium]